ncbi:hypothetical protein U1Q18_025166 [Sarracenia purpurea var. burkii]
MVLVLQTFLDLLYGHTIQGTDAHSEWAIYVRISPSDPAYAILPDLLLLEPRRRAPLLRGKLRCSGASVAWERSSVAREETDRLVRGAWKMRKQFGSGNRI